jgi:hypothetical protein
MKGDRFGLLGCDAVLLGTQVRAFRRKLVDQYSLKMQAVGLSETLEKIYQTTRRLIAEDSNIRIHRQESHLYVRP